VNIAVLCLAKGHDARIEAVHEGAQGKKIERTGGTNSEGVSHINKICGFFKSARPQTERNI
jgi:hypothetical protein